MNNDRFDTGRPHRWSKRDSGKNIYLGLFLLIVGGLLFADRAGVRFPFWFFSWPMLLIGIGILSGLKHNFKGGPWLILLGIGGIFLADKISDDLFLRPYFWPIIFIAGGIFIMTNGFAGKRRRRLAQQYNSQQEVIERPVYDDTIAPEQVSDYADIHQADVLDITAIFSGVKKNVLSKNFKGGDIVAIMGGAEINLTKADCSGQIIIDIFNMFGGTKLIVPPDWDVQNNVVAIFGGVDDKRSPSSFQNLSKVVVLEGTCIFGGIEIRSY